MSQININNEPSAEVIIDENGTPVTVIIATSGASGAVWGSITGTLSSQTDLQNALDAKVPYSGATGNVNLGEYGISTGYVQLDTTPTTYTAAVGNMGWNDSEGTIDLLLKGGVVSLPLGQKQVARVVNGTGGNVLKSNYQVVKVTGAQGQRLQVNLAQANNDANSADTLGLIAENINNNNSGFIITSGLIENINTTGSLQGETWADGNILYLSPTVAGRVTNVKPQAPQHTVIVGFVVYAHANNGKIFVKVDNGYELDELHNVKINTGTLTNGQVLKYNSSLQVWENNTDSAGVSGSGTQDYVAKFTATGSTIGDSIIRVSGTDATYFSTYKGANSNGDNIFIGGGGQSSIGDISNTNLGSYNTALGTSSLNANTTGYDNSAIGYGSLLSNTTGNNNVAVGFVALESNTTGFNNSAVGSYSLNNNTTGFNNVAVGVVALTQNTTGIFNTAVGSQSLSYNTVGLSNSAFGFSALGSNTTASYNSAFGDSALLSNTTGSSNTAVGDDALRENNIGGRNSALGRNALYGNTNGNNNTALGFQAGYGTGVNPNTTGANNIFIGYQSVGVSSTESNRTWIGNSSTTSTWLGGNLLLGSTTDAGQRLQVTGNAIIQGEIRGSGVGNTGSFISEDTQAGGATIRLTSQYGLGIPALLTDGSFPVVLATNNTEALRISTAQNLLLGTTTDVGTSILTMSSTSKGFLRPRMTTVQRDAIVSPATGLSIYNTTTNKVNYYNGTAWTEIQDTITNPVTGTGVSGQVSYWSGPNTQAGSNNLFWDNANGRLGIGNSSPFVRLDVGVHGVSGNTSTINVMGYSALGNLQHTGFGAVGSNYYMDGANALRRRFADVFSAVLFASAGFDFVSAGSSTAGSIISYSTLARLNSSGNFLINTTTDNGARLQVNGISSFTGTTASDGGQLGSELLSSANWTLGAGWTGDFTTGFAHSSGTATLTNTLAASNGTYYQIAYTVTNRTTGSFTISFGGYTSVNLSSTGSVGPRATSTASLVITPTTDFNGTIVFSVKVISSSTASIQLRNSSGTITNEIRNDVSNTNTLIGTNAGSRNIGLRNTIIGSGAGSNTTSGGGNTFTGFNSGFNHTVGGSNAFYGWESGFNSTTGGWNTFIGSGAGRSTTTGIGNVFIGASAGYNNTTGGSLISIGENTGPAGTGTSGNILIGGYVGQSVTNNNNVYVGGGNSTSGANNTAIGVGASANQTTGGNNLFAGYEAGRRISGGGNLTIASNSLFIGRDTRANADSETNQIVIGDSAIGLGSNTSVIGNSSTTFGRWWGNLLVGTSTNSGFALDVNGTARVQSDATINGLTVGRGANNLSSNTVFGASAGNAITSGANNTFIGELSGRFVTTGSGNTFLGRWTGIQSNTSSANVFIGTTSGQNNTTGSNNTYVGFATAQSNTTSNSNSFFGAYSGLANTGSSNSGFGRESATNQTTGSNNIFFGVDSGRRISGGGNLTIANNSTFLGYDTRANADSETNQLVIGYQAIGLGSNTTVIGNSSTTFGRWWGNLLVGSSVNSGQALQVTGTALFTGSVTGTGNSSTYTVTASSGLARSKSITSTLVASANNDVLVGLDINPTFTNGAFTGVTNTALRITGNTTTSGTLNASNTLDSFYTHQFTNLSTGTSAVVRFLLQSSDGGGAALAIERYGTGYSGTGIRSATRSGILAGGSGLGLAAAQSLGDIRFYIAGIASTDEKLRISATNGNLLINTTTDAGFKLDVNGTARIQSDATINGLTVGKGPNNLSANTIFGVSAGQSISNGNYNTYFGYLSGSSNTTSEHNSFFGGEAGRNTTSSNNSIFGSLAGNANTSGAGNSFFGRSSGRHNTTGSNISAFGLDSARYTNAGSNLTILNNSVFIGQDTRALADSDTNEIVIGYQGRGNGSNTTTIGNTSTTNNYIFGNFNVTDANNLVFGTTTGTKIGTATSQKLAFFGSTPVVQRQTTDPAATRVAGGGNTITDTDTFDGYTVATLVKALRDLGLLA